jgi:hypothetical protein
MGPVLSIFKKKNKDSDSDNKPTLVKTPILKTLNINKTVD